MVGTLHAWNSEKLGLLLPYAPLHSRAPIPPLFTLAQVEDGQSADIGRFSLGPDDGRVSKGQTARLLQKTCAARLAASMAGRVCGGGLGRLHT